MFCKTKRGLGWKKRLVGPQLLTGLEPQGGVHLRKDHGDSYKQKNKGQIIFEEKTSSLWRPKKKRMDKLGSPLPHSLHNGESIDRGSRALRKKLGANGRWTHHAVAHLQLAVGMGRLAAAYGGAVRRLHSNNQAARLPRLQAPPDPYQHRAQYGGDACMLACSLKFGLQKRWT